MTYTTKQGDMFDGIAHNVLGSIRHTGTLILSNPDYAGIFKFDAGCVLQLPAITAQEAAGLPPWKEGAT